MHGLLQPLAILDAVILQLLKLGQGIVQGLLGLTAEAQGRLLAVDRGPAFDRRSHAGGEHQARQQSHQQRGRAADHSAVQPPSME